MFSLTLRRFVVYEKHNVAGGTAQKGIHSGLATVFFLLAEAENFEGQILMANATNSNEFRTALAR